jgi:hypothetical protein
LLVHFCAFRKIEAARIRPLGLIVEEWNRIQQSGLPNCHFRVRTGLAGACDDEEVKLRYPRRCSFPRR